MGLLQTSLIWVVYAIVIAILILAASFLIYTYQTPRDRSKLVTLTCIAAISTLLATVLLLPVDIALISSTTSTALGRRKDWATQSEIDRILFSLKALYYLLYSIDALLCLIVIPFTYFWYEEYDEVAAQAGEQTTAQQFWAASKYTISFIAISAVLFLVGFFVPVSKEHAGGLDFFKHLLSENRKLGLFPFPFPAPKYHHSSPYCPCERGLRKFCRRRANPYLCAGLAGNSRHVLVHFLHLNWTCSSPS